MILAEKIIKLRKQQGWSQEDLAMHMGVSRQSVSKWESMASIPDLDKIIKLSELFGVSTDYLLKDEVEDEPVPVLEADVKDEYFYKRSVTLDEANEFMELRSKASIRIAAGVAACIISPVLLIVLAGYAETGLINITENMAAGIGTAALLVIVAAAVMNFITAGMKLKPYEFLEKELLDLEYGVAGIAEKKKNDYSNTHKMSVAMGVGLCILSVVPLLIAVAFTEAEQAIVTMVGMLLIMVAAGVFIIVRTVMIMETYDQLLEEGDYSPEKKMEAKKNTNLSTAYWCGALAIYLLWSFLSGDWQITWIVWPVAGVLFGGVCAVANMVRSGRKS